MRQGFHLASIVSPFLDPRRPPGTTFHNYQNAGLAALERDNSPNSSSSVQGMNICVHMIHLEECNVRLNQLKNLTRRDRSHSVYEE